VSIFFTIIPLFLSLYALAKIPSSTIGIIIYLNPIISFSIAFFYFHERASWLQIISYEILFLAVLIFNSEFIKELYQKRRSPLKPLNS
jgi:chloramphenicol-sensitive protein RarD